MEILPPEPPRRRPPEPSLRAGLDAVDAVEAEVARTAREVAGVVEALRADAASARDGLCATAGHLASRDPGALAAGAEAAAAAADTLAEEAAGLGAVLEQAGRHLDRAGESQAEAGRAASLLGEAAGAIAGAVEQVARLARAAHLLAQQATVEAARLGEAGEGCTRMARDAARLSAEGLRAGEAIRALGRHCEGGVRAAASAAALAEASVTGLAPVLATLREASAGQAGQARRIAGTARVLAGEAGEIGAEVAVAQAAVTGAVARATRLDEALHDLAGIGPRLAASLRQAEIGDRRVHDRYPVDLPARVGRSGVGRVRDLGAGGLLLAPPAGAVVPVDTVLALDLRGIGRIGVRVVGTSARGLHCAFATEADAASCAPALARIGAAHAPFVAAAQDLAGAIGAALEGAVEAGRLFRDVLFAPLYTPVPGAPGRFTTAAGPVLEEILPPLLGPRLRADPRLVHCVAVDRQGYAAVSDDSGAQGPQRFHDDPAGLAAARSGRAFLVQLWPGEGAATVREVSAPIRVQGRHWGAVRMGYRG